MIQILSKKDVKHSESLKQVIYLVGKRLLKTVSNKQVTKDIEKGNDLQWIYLNLDLTEEQITKALNKDSYDRRLRELYFNQGLDKEHIDICLGNEAELWSLYTHQSLTEKQIDVALDIGKDLIRLFKHQGLTEEHVDKALERGEWLDQLYLHQNLSEEQINKAIEKGKHLGFLKEHQELNSKQLTVLNL